LAAELARLIEGHDDLELFAPPTTGVVLWRPRDANARAIRTRLRRVSVSLTEVAGETWLRSVAANPLADPRLVVDEVRAAIAG